MVRTFRALCALAAIAAITSYAPVGAQNSPITIDVRNNTSMSLWVTFYKRDASGIGGTLAAPVIVSSGDRGRTGPTCVAANTTHKFVIPRTRWLRLRTELENRCGSGARFDTQFTRDSVADLDYIKYTVHYLGHGNPWISSP